MREREPRYHLPSFELFPEKISFPWPAGLREGRSCDLVLINAPFRPYSKRERRGYVPNSPLGEGYILAVATETGKNCGLIDGEGLGLTPEEIIEATNDVQPEYIGINLFSPITEFTMSLIKELKPRSKIIVGGPHASICPEDVLARETDVSIVVVRGEGEEIVKEILEGRPVDKIKGISFRRGEEIVHNPGREFIRGLDDLPFVNRDFLEVDPYKRDDYVVSSISTSRGCPYQCTFCAGPELSGRMVRFRSMRNVVREIKELVESRYRVNYFRFIDDCFLLGKNRAGEFLDELEKEDLMSWFHWDALIRADTVLEFSDETLLNFKKSGVEFLSMGIETSDPKRLEAIQKDITLKEIERAVERCASFDIPVKGFFILGFPGETEEDMWWTINFALNLRQKGLAMATFNELHPYPGTPIWFELLKEDWTPQELANYQYVNLTEPGDEESTGRYLRERGKHFTGLRRNISEVPPERLREILKEAILAFGPSSIPFYERRFMRLLRIPHWVKLRLARSEKARVHLSSHRQENI